MSDEPKDFRFKDHVAIMNAAIATRDRRIAELEGALRALAHANHVALDCGLKSFEAFVNDTAQAALRGTETQ